MTKDSAKDKGFSLPFARVALIMAALIAVGAISIAMLRARADDSPSTPAVASTPPEKVPDIASLIGQLEQKMAANPDDPKGWQFLGVSYYQVGRYADAVTAYTKAAKLDPDNSMIWSALGEAQLLSGPGGVTPDAERSFRKALAIDPKDHRARYFLAVKKDRDGAHAAAIDDLIAILGDSPAGASWIEPVRRLTEKIAAQNNIDIAGRLPEIATAPQAMADMPPGGSIATAGIPGPNAADLKAATAMTPAQQDEMARGMVDRLAARLADNPKNADGWIMLMRSRLTLGDKAGAQAALNQAKAAFQGDAAQRARFDDAAQTLGILR